MSFNTEDTLREVSRRLDLVERTVAYSPVREATPPASALHVRTADALILPGARGAVRWESTSAPQYALNTTGHPIWKGSTVWVDDSRNIVATNAANVLWGDWDDALTKFNSDSYSFVAANKDHFDGDGLEDIDLYDPAGLLSDIDASEPWVCMATGEGNTLTVIGTSAGGTGGGGGDGFPWPGPGSGPQAGTSMTIVLKATVNQSGGVSSSNATFPFDGAADVIGTSGITSGTASNTFLQAFTDNEPIYLLLNNAGGWDVIKVIRNVAIGSINDSNGVRPSDGTFNLDGMASVSGPVAATGTGSNAMAQEWEDNEKLLLELIPNGTWLPIGQVEPTALFFTQSNITAASFDAGTGELTTGSGNARRLKLKSGSTTVWDQIDSTNIVIRNSARFVIPSGRNVQCKRINGVWFVDVDDCA